jgi:hypothetical protein
MYKRAHRKINRELSTLTEVFINQKRVNIHKHTVKIAPCAFIAYSTITKFLKKRVTYAYKQ